MIRTIQGCVLGLAFIIFANVSCANAITFNFVDTNIASHDVGTLTSADVSPGIDVNANSLAGPIDLDFFFLADVLDPLETTMKAIFSMGAFLNIGDSGFDPLAWTITGSSSGLLDSGSLAFEPGLPLNPLTRILTLIDGETITINFLGTALAQGGSLDITISAVPIPAAGLLFGGALAGIGFLSRRRRKKTLEQAAI